MLYALFAMCISSYVAVIVNDTRPDTDQYPPLPDLILDNLAYMEYAFYYAEFCGIFLNIIWLLILVFHKHRLVLNFNLRIILIRRFFTILGTIIILRTVTTRITSLSVPNKHWPCTDNVICCWATLDSPNDLYFLRSISWFLNFMGMFFILASHEHYSIDVFIAFFVASRIASYYHALSNCRVNEMAYMRRFCFEFPLLYFFEQNDDSRVLNEYHIPFYDYFCSFYQSRRDHSD
ncbi:sphingomyelin synthase-related protein 1-like [Octopus sinensis]|uniref:Sphingomyelin synthase-related protein 1-like n=1 Tax=Octopus sinensis TaxID=2607531 RepID=A0A7E6EL03_9MOLL|nr:sphingomyelin synthase-related protein 1-like [Octopus sinensis]